MKKTISPKLISLCISITTILFVCTFFAFAWTEPGAAPPGGNVSVPINTGNLSQYKSGKLGISTSGIDPNYGFTVGSEGIKVTGNSYFEGDITATGQICDSNSCVGVAMLGTENLQVLSQIKMAGNAIVVRL